MRLETLELPVKVTGNKEANSALTNLTHGLQSVSSFISIAKDAFQALDSTIGDAVRTTISYAAEVRLLQNITGDTAENTSRLIQVTDDYKISVDDLNKAQKQLATKGITLSVEALANLSDEYLKLNTGAEKQLFLSEKFGGRVGQNFAEVMQQGGDALRAKNAAVKDGLILDEAAIRQARQYEITQDNLNDSWTALKINAGERAIPLLTVAMNSLNRSSEGWNRELNVAIARLERLPLDSVTSGYQNMAMAIEKADAAAKTANEDLSASIENMTDAMETLTNFSGDYVTAIDKVSVALLKQKLAADGAFDPADAQMVQDLERSLGLLSDTAVSNTRMIDLLTTAFMEGKISADQLKSALDNLPKDTDISVNVTYHVIGGIGLPEPTKVRIPGKPTEMRASYGPVIAGQAYNVAEFYKPERFIPNVSGRISPLEEKSKPVLAVISDTGMREFARVLAEEMQKTARA